MQVALTQRLWKQVYHDALFELDPESFAAKLEAAERVIDERLREVVSSGAANRLELTELEHAKGVVLYFEDTNNRAGQQKEVAQESAA